ncbi:DUF3822 family protein [Flavihumibacter petaseus]|uniref:DUF3822 family protein n=1 Tax=Flavihumibacter petaseus NBRC 106054 TaxID=1220578 RepID=A0A0E9N423_9BACT|nr:DUF3822 family protein [Flavihumibacter petaseus]GAO44574.1 hypothetical protein FPE01S_03_06120 [Flavihumibacter petaseus NBRC 106054]
MSYSTRFELELGTAGQPAEAILLLQVNNAGLQMLVADRDRKPLRFSMVEFDRETAETGSLSALSEWLAENREWTRQWGRVVVVHDCQQATIVPASLYNVDNGKELLDLQFGDLFKGTLLTEQITGRQDYTVYRISTEAYHTLSAVNGITVHRHLYSLWMAWLEKQPTAADGQAFMLFEASHVVMAVRKEDWLLLQQYEYQQPEDISYYLLAVLSQYDLSPETAEVHFNGWIDLESSLYAELKKYILNLRVAAVPGDLTWDLRQLDDQPAHYFTPLMQMATCV